jgi:RNA 3'-terminal phosphate cyclase (ATP)/RNA 3'-terminal phosphate cyclase (GTP)
MAVAELCDGEVDGLDVGSKEVTFHPGDLTGGVFEFDVGTAGSIPLVLQACILPASMSKSSVTLTVKGGTDTRWSPPIDFVRLVHLPMVGRMGISCDVELVSRGFYPEGGGEVTAHVGRCPALKGIEVLDKGAPAGVTGTAYAQNLPDHVVSRLKHAALKGLVGHSEAKLESDLRSGRSTGAGMVLAAVYENTVLGESVLGQRGVRAEALGEACASGLVETMRSGATVDEHTLDQLIPYMALASGGSAVVAEEMTGHAETNIWVAERFLGSMFKVARRDGLVDVKVG